MSETIAGFTLPGGTFCAFCAFLWLSASAWLPRHWARPGIVLNLIPMPDLLIEPIMRPFNVTLAPPGSKSLTNRALVLAALASGTCELSNVLFADDTLVMLECLTRLGFEVKIDRATHSVRVGGQAGRIPVGSAELFCGNSGTTIRFLAGLCAVGNGEIMTSLIPV